MRGNVCENGERERKRQEFKGKKKMYLRDSSVLNGSVLENDRNRDFLRVNAKKQKLK